MIAGLIAITGLLWSRTSDLQDTVTALQHAARNAPGGAKATDTEAIKQLTTCVNSYMKTIGVWSSNVNDRYNYNFC